MVAEFDSVRIRRIILFLIKSLAFLLVIIMAYESTFVIMLWVIPPAASDDVGDKHSFFSAATLLPC